MRVGALKEDEGRVRTVPGPLVVASQWLEMRARSSDLTGSGSESAPSPFEVVVVGVGGLNHLVAFGRVQVVG